MSEVEHRERFAYQPALDGLRALAVLGVVFYHYTLGSDAGGWASGGFLGVDVFFVLSGFLITSLLAVEWRREGRISLRGFWARRVRRLLPALLLTLFLVALYAAFVADATQQDRIRTDAFATLLYVQNWHTIDAGALDQSVLGHAWSLSIEEQWYLLWPLAFGALLAWVGGRTRRVVPILVVLALGSAALMAALYVPGDNARVYFGTDTRAQELLVGAALGLVLLAWRGPASRGARIALDGAGLTAFGLLLLAVPFVDISAPWLYRGGFLLVSLLTALVITAVVTSRDSALGRLLSIRVLVLVGLISYGVYLLHVPVRAVLSPERTGLDVFPLLALRIAVTMVLAVVSYLVVEMPVRRGALRARWAAVAVPAAVGALVMVLVVGTAGGVARSPESDEPYLLRRARQEAPDGAYRALVIGDASAALLGVAMGGPFDGGGIRGVALGSTACDAIGGSALVAGAPVEPDAQCGSVLDRRFERAVGAYAPDVVVVMTGRAESLDRLAGKQVLRAGSPELARFLSRELDRWDQLAKDRGAALVLLTVPCGPSEPAGTANLEWVNGVWRAYASAAGSGVVLADLAERDCPAGRHRTDAGDSRAFWDWLAPSVRAAAESRSS